MRSGVLVPGTEVYNSTQDRSEKISQLFFGVGKNRVEAQSLSAGDIGIAVKLRNSRTNDTLCDRSAPIRLDPVQFPPPVIDFAIRPVNAGDEDKMANGLARIAQEDSSFRYHYDENSQQTLASGMGETHLYLIVARLRDRYGVSVDLSPPRVPYRETVRGKAPCRGAIRSRPADAASSARSTCVSSRCRAAGDSSSSDEISAVSCRTSTSPRSRRAWSPSDGPRPCWPAIPSSTCGSRCSSASYHDVDSSEMAFKIAAIVLPSGHARSEARAARADRRDPGARLPEEFLGDVMGDLSSRRGKILGTEADGHYQ